MRTKKETKKVSKEVKEVKEVVIPTKEYFEHKEIISKRMITINGKEYEELTLANGTTLVK